MDRISASSGHRTARGIWHHCRTVLHVLAFLTLALPKAQAGDLKAIGVLVGDLGNPFFAELGKGAETAARELGGSKVRVTVRSSGYDLERQSTQIDAFIRDGIDILILNAVDTNKIEPAVLRARAAGMVVIATDVKAAGASATVTSDNYQAGKLACRYMAERLHGKGRALILNGPPVSSVRERVIGCRSELANSPSITVLPDDEDCGGSLDGGLACMTGMMVKYPHIDGVFTINDPTATGANIAADRAERKEFFIVSVDGSPQAVDVLGDPNTRFAATVAQNPRRMAELAVRMGIDLFQGKKPAETLIEMPVTLMTADKVKDYAGWGR
jgi:ribose transport system substrate-binding protein